MPVQVENPEISDESGLSKHSYEQPDLGMANMELSESERAEFNELANATYDPQLWSEDELPILRKTKADNERQQEWERNHPHLIQQPTLTDEDENGWPYDPCIDRRY